MKRLGLDGHPHLRSAQVGGDWITDLRLWRPAGDDALTTGPVETAVVVLAGTFDLVGNGTAWPARGARASEFEGRPMAVYLPPVAEFRAANGRGELLLVSARQPAAPTPDAGREGLSRKPLLPLAGSGKAFDPGTGEWRPAETFPTSAESLPPRRMQRLPVGEAVVERVFAPDYKAATLSIDECALGEGQSLALDLVPQRPPAREVLLFVRSEHSATVRAGGAEGTVAGDAAFLLTAAEVAGATVRAATGRTYVLIAWAGK